MQVELEHGELVGQEALGSTSTGATVAAAAGSGSGWAAGAALSAGATEGMVTAAATPVVSFASSSTIVCVERA